MVVRSTFCEDVEEPESWRLALDEWDGMMTGCGEAGSMGERRKGNEQKMW